MNPETSGTEHIDFKVSDENPYVATEAPSVGLDKDPRFQTIRAELITAWEQTHGESILSGQGQDYLFGETAVHQRGQEPISIDQRVEAVFKERFPEDAAAYAVKEKTRVYADPHQDPQIRQTEERITKAINKSVSDARNGKLGRIAAKDAQGGDFWDRMSMAENLHTWASFVMSYPEKAAAYRDIMPQIERALSWQESRAPKPKEYMPEANIDQVIDTLLETHRQQLEKKTNDIVVERDRLEVLPFVKGEIMGDVTVPDENFKTQVVDTDLIVGSVQFSFADWSGNPDETDQRNALIEAIATDFIADAKVGTTKSVQRAFDTRNSLSVKLGRIDGPEGPIYIAKDGSHRIAASKLAEMPKVLAKVETWSERKNVKTKSAARADEWAKLIERGLVAGIVEKTSTGEFALKVEQQILPWCTAKQGDFTKSNLAYYSIYPEAFKNIKSLKDGKPLPEAIFLDKTGYFLNLFLYRPQEFATQVKS